MRGEREEGEGEDEWSNSRRSGLCVGEKGSFAPPPLPLPSGDARGAAPFALNRRVGVAHAWCDDGEGDGEALPEEGACVGAERLSIQRASSCGSRSPSSSGTRGALALAWTLPTATADELPLDVSFAG